MKPSRQVLAIVLDRDRHCCAFCGYGGEGLQVHHRHPRKMGSTKLHWINQPANLITLCERHHRFMERHREIAEAWGYLIPMGLAVARSTKVRTWRGWVYLGDEGEVIPTTAPPP